MARDGAVERVLARLELGADLRRAALRHRLAVLVEAARPLERDVVRHRRRVVHDDAHGAGLGAERGLVELELTARVGAQGERLRRLTRRRLLAGLAAGRLAAGRARAG